jgi:S1-C subfamily serine protease
MLAAPSAHAGLLGGQDCRDALVKVETVTNAPDYYNPWKMQNSGRVGGSGVIISGSRILTNAHVVANHSMIQVRRNGHWKTYNGHILHISHEADLALLTTDDKDFFAGVEGLPFGDLPKSQQEVFVYGFPMGGDSLSVTRGVLSRLEHQPYAHSGMKLFAGQIDAAINPGNSGGPVLVNNRIVGLVMQGANPGKAENMGFMIPVPVIKHFLTDIEDGTLDGFPDAGIEFQGMDNPGMKSFYRMALGQTGILVTRVYKGSPAEGKVKSGDVILSVAGHSIADDGTVEFRPRERTIWEYYLDSLQMGSRVSMTILRDGRPAEVSLVLNKKGSDFVPVPTAPYGQPPRYIIYGGMVFSPLTRNVSGLALSKGMRKEFWKKPGTDRQERVVVVQVLAADVNKGYEKAGGMIIDAIDGYPVADFADFAAKIEKAGGPYVVLENYDNCERIVLDRQQALLTHEDILKTYHIPGDRAVNVAMGR